MTLRRWGFMPVATLAMVLGLLSLLSESRANEGLSVVKQGQPGCTVTVQPGQSIQQAIDAAQEGAVICLTAGRWSENIQIGKSLKLHGTGKEHSQILGKPEEQRPLVYKPVIHIASETEISVDIEELSVSGITFTSGIFSSILIEGKAQVTITNTQFSGHSGDGIWLKGAAQATLADSLISDSETGIQMTDLARLTITHSVVSDSDTGIWLEDSAQATIARSQISNNKFFGITLSDSAHLTAIVSVISHNMGGIVMSGFAQATVIASQITDNTSGIVFWDLAQLIMKESKVSNNRWIGIGVNSGRLIIDDSQILNNGWIGITLSDSQATITASVVQYNGMDEASCRQKEFYCNGIFVGEHSQVKLVRSKVMVNADWGIGATLRSCGAALNRFPDQVLFEDMPLEDISGNNTTRNQDGMGNPGNHPWNRPDVPDGQVCLP